MFVLIVKEEKEQITKCMHGIKACLQTVSPHVTVQHKSLLDLSGDRSKIKCDKIIFILSTRLQSLDIAETEWIEKLQNINKEDYIFVRFGSTTRRGIGNADVIKEHDTDIVNNNIVKEITKKERKRRQNLEAVELTDDINKLQDTLIHETVRKVLHNDHEAEETDKSKRQETNENQKQENDGVNSIEELAQELENESDKVEKDNAKDDTEEKVAETVEETEIVTPDKGNEQKSGGKGKNKKTKRGNKGKNTKATKKEITAGEVKGNTEQGDVEDKENENETLAENNNNELEAKVEDKGKETGAKMKDVVKETEKVTSDDTKESDEKAKDKVKSIEKISKFKVKNSKVAPLLEDEAISSFDYSNRAVKDDEKASTSSDYHRREEREDKKLGNNNDHICVSNFEKELFNWWPSLLVFLFGTTIIGRWVKEEKVPRKHIYCLHHYPDSKQTAHPITRQVLAMLQIFGAHETQSHHENKQCCLLMCKDSGMNLPIGQKSQLVKSSKHVHVFAVALYGSSFSEDLLTITDRCFTRFNLMSLILTLLTELNLINVQSKHFGKQHGTTSWLDIPNLLFYFLAYAMFIFNLPALIVHLATTMVLLWPVFIIFCTKSSLEKVKYINYGFIGSSIVAILTVIITEASLYPDFFPYPISVPISVYLIIWQIGVGINLKVRYDYQYGIFSIPSQILTKV